MSAEQRVKFVLVLASNPRNIGKVEGFLLKINQRMKLGDNEFNKLLVAATEAVNNSIIHGNKRNPKKKVVLTCELNHAELSLRVQDEGPGVDANALPDPLAVENIMRENGRGVFLMKSLMDQVDFEKFEKGAAVTMKMQLHK